MTIEGCQAFFRWRSDKMGNSNNSDTDHDGESSSSALQLQRSLNQKQASLTHIEKAFLSALLIDKPPTSDGEAEYKNAIENATNVLNDDILFSVPVIEKKVEQRGVDIEISKHVNAEEGKGAHPLPPRPTRSNQAQLDLWKAHDSGVRPMLLRQKSKWSSIRSSPSSGSQIGGNTKRQQSRRRRSSRGLMKNQIDDTTTTNQENEESEDCNSLDALSDQEVGSINDESSASSWNSSQGGFENYNAWEVLRDEYAEDFGFKVAIDDENEILPCVVDDESRHGMFKILGTSAQDTSALPHVLSPPMMDSLLNFVPDHLVNDNFWLKFSLVRDGASLDILRRYCRAATHTILAIETTNGEVFGSFQSSPWRLNNKYFGTGEAFLWRMRHSRNSVVHCLFDQAQLESEIDIFPYNGSNDYIQLCTSDKLALGGGTMARESSIQEGEPLEMPTVFLEDVIYGFGLALDENLLHGTTSPCQTFGNSNLVNRSTSGETFDVMNLEVWGFTSAQTEREAEQSEMSMFFVRESVSSNLSSSSAGSSPVNSNRSSPFSGDDLSRDRFYRRVGQNDENESDRNAWQYSNTMNPMAGSPYGKLGSTYGR